MGVGMFQDTGSNSTSKRIYEEAIRQGEHEAI